MSTQNLDAFRTELRAWLADNMTDELRPENAIKIPEAERVPRLRAWQAKLAAARWVGITWPEEYGGRAASIPEQIAYTEEMARAEAPQVVGSLGIGIAGPPLIAYGTEEQKRRFARRILAADDLWCFGFSEPGAGSDLASLRTTAILDGDHFVVNGQKVWTSGAHDADFLLAFVRTDPDAPKHKGISALIIPTDTAGVVCRPFADMCGQDNLDFNEVFFTDARVPAENLVGPLNGGWGVANGSLGHERTMMWLGFADRIDNMIADFRPRTELERDQFATTIMDYLALRAMGSAALARAARGEMDTASVSVLKLFGSEAERQAFENALTAAGTDGLVHPSTTGPYAHMNLDHYFASWFERYARSFGGTIAGGTSEIQRNIIATQVLGLPRR